MCSSLANGTWFFSVVTAISTGKEWSFIHHYFPLKNLKRFCQRARYKRFDMLELKAYWLIGRDRGLGMSFKMEGIIRGWLRVERKKSKCLMICHSTINQCDEISLKKQGSLCQECTYILISFINYGVLASVVNRYIWRVFENLHCFYFREITWPKILLKILSDLISFFCRICQ